MDENLEEIIKIAWKAAPGNTEYYLGRYVVEVTRQLNQTIDTMNDYDDLDTDTDTENFYSSLVQKEKVLQKKLNRLNRLISSLRGS